MNQTSAQNQSQIFIDQQFKAAKSLHENARFAEVISVLEGVLPSIQSSGERMLTAKTIVIILFHDILKGYPQPNTSEYEKFRYYLNISLSNYGLAEENYQRQYLYVHVGKYENELELHKSILGQMNRNVVIQEKSPIVKTSPIWHEREVFKAGQRLDYELDILHRVKAVRYPSGETLIFTNGDDKAYAQLHQDNAKQVASFAPGDARVIDAVKQWAARTDGVLVTTWRPSEGYELWVTASSSANISTGGFLGRSMALGCLCLVTFPVVWIIAYLIVCFVAAGIGFNPARYFGQVVLVSLFGSIAFYVLIAASIWMFYMYRRKGE